MDSNRAKAPIGSRSQCKRFREPIIGKLNQGLSAQRIFQDLVQEYGFSGKYRSVRRFVGHLRKTTPLSFRRVEVAPGEEAQIDFGQGAPIVDEQGRRRRPHVLRVVLSHSRKAYSEVVYRKTTENLIRCLENAFWHFGGVPNTLVPDNLKAAVIEADWYNPDLNPKLRSFCEHFGTVLLPTKPRTPRHTAHANQCYRLANIRELIQHAGAKQQQFGFLDEHPIIRNLSEEFDWGFNPTIKKNLIYDLATGRFIKERRDVLFCSPPGTGKSHLVQGVGYHLIKLGYVVLYRSDQGRESFMR